MSEAISCVCGALLWFEDSKRAGLCRKCRGVAPTNTEGSR